LFAALNEGIHFACDEEVQAAVGKLFRKQAKYFKIVGSENSFSDGVVVSSKKATTWKNEA